MNRATYGTRQYIGIIGGGQLARMSALAAYRLGMQVAILDPDQHSPAAQAATRVFTGNTDSTELLKQFAANCSVVTLENEFISPDVLQLITDAGTPVFPSPTTIALIQDKLIQKQTLRKKGLPVTDFLPVEALTGYQDVSKRLGSTFILKSRIFGYDGYGNRMVTGSAGFSAAKSALKLRHTGLYAERISPFIKELAVMVAKNGSGSVVYPVVETIQQNHICKYVLSPAGISPKTARMAKELAEAAVDAVQGQGLFGIEFFYEAGGRLLINEMAPRPHNSGHFTIDACITSQFENHIRAVTGLPLGSTAMTCSAAVMVNLLGKKNSAAYRPRLKSVLSHPDAHVHIYGKAEERKGRKMGHITVTGRNCNLLLQSAKQFDKEV